MEKRIIPVALVVLSLSSMLIFADNIESAYAVTITNYNITGSPNFFNRVGNTMFTINTTTGAFRVIDLLSGVETVSSTVDTTGANFRGFRCSIDDCWQMRGAGTTDCYLTRISTSTGAQEEQIHYTNDCSGSNDIGLSSGETIFFGRKCTTGDIGSSGAGDTDLAVFSVDGNSMSGTPVQHTDCGSNFTPISSSSQGLIGYKQRSIGGTNRLAVITNGAVGGADIFTYINLEQELTSTTNTQMCQVTMTTSNSFLSFQGRNIQFSGNTAYVNVGSGTDVFIIHTITSICGNTNSASITAFETNTANIALDTTRDILYLGGIEADATGVLIVGYNFTGDTVTTTQLTSVTPDSTVASASSDGWDYNLTTDIGYYVSTSKIYVVDFGGVVEGSGGNQENGVCGNGTALECVGDRSTINQITGGQNITDVVGDLLTGLGIANTTANTDPETNGTGLFLMLITGTFFSSATIASIAVANNKFGANISYTQIPKEYWLFLVVGVVAVAFYLNWIPDIVFYGMIVGLAGLFAFGLYRQARGGE